MSSAPTNTILNYSLFLFFQMIALSFETFLWPYFLSPLPAPSTWLTTLTFWAIFRNLKESFIFALLLVGVLSFYSSLPLNVSLPTMLIVLFCTRMARKEFKISSPLAFASICSLQVLFVPVIGLLVSILVEKESGVLQGFWPTLGQSLITFPYGMLIYVFYNWLDRVTHKTLPIEVNEVYEKIS